MAVVKGGGASPEDYDEAAEKRYAELPKPEWVIRGDMEVKARLCAEAAYEMNNRILERITVSAPCVPGSCAAGNQKCVIPASAVPPGRNVGYLCEVIKSLSRFFEMDYSKLREGYYSDYWRTTAGLESIFNDYQVRLSVSPRRAPKKFAKDAWELLRGLSSELAVKPRGR